MNWDQGSAGGGLPFRLVGVVATGGVEHRDSHLSAGVAFDGIGDGDVVFVVVVV